MDIPSLAVFRLGHFIYSFTEDVKNTSQCLFSDRNADRMSRIDNIYISRKTICRSHGNTSGYISADMLGYFQRQQSVSDFYSQSI